MKTCPKCNLKVDDNAKICSHCGHPLVSNDSPMKQKNEQLRESVVKEIQKRNRKEGRIAFVNFVILAALAIAIGFMIYYFFVEGNDFMMYDNNGFTDFVNKITKGFGNLFK